MCIRDRFKSSLKTKEKDDPVKSLPEVHEGDVLDGILLKTLISK